MPADWSSFLAALAARGVRFADVEQASDRKAVIQSVGITDALDVAILETHWARHVSAGAGSQPQPSQQRAPAAVGAGSSAPLVSGGHRVDPARLRNEPEDLQDAIIAEELAYALRGISGALIRFDADSRRPSVHPQLPTSTAHMILAALQSAAALFALEPICRHEYAGGSLIRGAVGEAVREVCAAYVRSIADLLHNNGNNGGGAGTKRLSLSRLCTEADGRGYAVRRLAALFGAINDPQATGNLPQAPDGGGLTGPWLLNEIHLAYKKALGHPDDERIIGTVLHRAARPYLQILFDWMHRGELHNDPFNEFFVVDNDRLLQHQQRRGAAAAATATSGDAAPKARDALDRWENRFRLVANQVPFFITESRLYRSIFVSGKYCHMLRDECGADGAAQGGSSIGSGSAGAIAADASPSSAAGVGIFDPDQRAFFAARHGGAGGGSANNSGARSRRDAAQQQQQQQQQQGKGVFTVTFLNEDDPISVGAPGEEDRSAAATTAMMTAAATATTETSRFEWGDARKLESAVHRASKVASENVLRMLQTRHRLLDRLRSLRYYFFIAHGDWLVNFLDAAQKLLHRPANEVKVYSLNVLLQSSISKSSARDDPCHGFTRCSLADVTLREAVALTRRRDPTFTNVHRGGDAGAAGSAAAASSTTAPPPCYELLQLEVVSEWPLSLILNDVFTTKLNFAFRLLLRFKICERALNSLVWHAHQQQHHQPLLGGGSGGSQQRNLFGNAAGGGGGGAAAAAAAGAGENPDASAYQTAAASLRAQLLQFVRQFQFYAAHEVLEPAWKTFLHKVENAAGIINIGSASTDLCQSILRGLAITSEHGIDVLWQILDMCMAFAQQHHAFFTQQQQHGGVGITLESSKQQLARWQTHLYELLKKLADPSQPADSSLMQMLVWLDFNAFYEKLGVYRVRHAVRHPRQDEQQP